MRYMQVYQNGGKVFVMLYKCHVEFERNIW